MIVVDALVDDGFRACRGAVLVLAAGSEGLAGGFAAWTCGFTTFSRAGFVCAEAGANVGAGAATVTGAASSSCPSTMIGAVRCV